MTNKIPWSQFFLSRKSEQSMSLNWSDRFKLLSRQVKKAPLIDFYKTPLPNADTPIDQVKLLAIDLETTGMDPEEHDIVSIGMVPFTIHGIELGGSCHMLIKPEMPLSRESAAIHSITHTELSRAEGFHAHFNTLLESMKNHISVVHYHRMERRFLAHSVNRYFSDPFEFPLIDTMMLEDRLMHQEKRPTIYQRWVDTILKKRSHTHSLRLDAARRRYHLPRYAPHHALTDAISTAELFMAQVQVHFDPKTPLDNFWI